MAVRERVGGLHCNVTSSWWCWLGMKHTVLRNLTPLFPNYSFFHRYTYYSQRNSPIICWGLSVASIFCFILCDQRLFYAQSHSGDCHVVYEHATAPFFCMCTCSGSPHNVIHSSSYNPQGLFSVQCFQLIHAFCLGTRVPRHRDSVVRRTFVSTSLAYCVQYFCTS